MDLSIQSVRLNVSDLAVSIAFYQEVLDLRLLSEGDRVAVLMINENERVQVLQLREVGRNVTRSGRGAIGSRLVAFEVGSPEELDEIEKRLAQRDALFGHLQTDTYRGIIGHDPDQIDVSVASSLTGTPIGTESWTTIHDGMYAIE